MIDELLKYKFYEQVWWIKNELSGKPEITWAKIGKIVITQYPEFGEPHIKYYGTLSGPEIPYSVFKSYEEAEKQLKKILDQKELNEYNKAKRITNEHEKKVKDAKKFLRRNGFQSVGGE